MRYVLNEVMRNMMPGHFLGNRHVTPEGKITQATLFLGAQRIKKRFPDKGMVNTLGIDLPFEVIREWENANIPVNLVKSMVTTALQEGWGRRRRRSRR